MTAVALLRHPLAVLALGLLVLPVFVYAIGMTDVAATKLAIFVLVGLGFNVLLGYTGLVSFGHSMFFGLAAYAAALFQLHVMPGSVVVAFLVAAIFAALLGVVVGFLILRRRGVYFALLTLAFTAMWFSIVYRWTGFTGGENGLRGITRSNVFGADLDDGLVFYYLVAGIVLMSAVVIWRLLHSPIGRVFLAIRENEQRCRFLGYRVTWYKLLAITVSGIIVGLAGALFAFLMYFVSADLVSVPFAGEIVAMSVIGGSGYFLGPPVGAIFYIVFQEWLSAFTSSWQLWFGLLFVVLILFSPDGLMGLGARLTAPLRRGEERAAAMAARVTPTPAREVPAFLRQASGPGGGPILHAVNLRKAFGPVQAVAGVDIALHAGELKVVIGPNGAGKTSLFNLLSGQYAPDEGRIHFEGREIHGLATEAFPRMGICRSFQIINLFDRLTVEENLRLAVQASHRSRFHPFRRADRVPEAVAETRELLRFIGLEGLESVPVSELSGGGKRLLEIGLALAAKPRALLLDEPLAGLAAGERDRIVHLIKTLAGHTAILMVEHDIDRAFEMARHITVMHDGRILADGTPEEVRENREVQEIYLGRGTHEVTPLTGPRIVDEPAETLLRLDGVNTFYDSSHVLHDVSMELRGSEIVALLGRNGAGKSTAIKTVIGMPAPRSGRIELAGSDITGRAPEAVARLGIGYVPQGRRLWPNLTVADNIRLGRMRAGGAGAITWTDEDILDYFPKVDELRGRRAGVLSGGEQQMVAIARALAGNCRLLMLDEPFEGLAPTVTDELFAAIAALRAKLPILIVEHDLDRVLALADRVYVLDRGAVTHEGPAQPLLTNLDYRKEVLWLS